MKRVMFYTFLVLATVTAVFILWQFRLIVLLFILSLLVAAAIRPLVEWLSGHGLPRPAAQLITYLILAGAVLLLVLLAVNQLAPELNSVVNKSVIEYESLHRRWQEGESWQRVLSERLPQPYSPANNDGMEISELLPAVMNVTTWLTGFVAGLLLILALSIYWSVDQHRFERLWLSLLPAATRSYARDSWREIEASTGNYLRSQAAQSALAALALGLAGALAGYPFPLLLAFAGALGAFIPLFGGLITAVAAFWLGSLQSVGMGAAAAVFTIILFLALEFLVEPRLWPRERRSVLLTILILFPMWDSFGIWGLLAAPFLAAIAETLIRQSYKLFVARRTAAVDFEQLTARYQQLSSKMAEAEEEGASALELKSLSERLAHLLGESKSLAGP
jgi:putative permease